jgi:hypothetical protein
LSPSLPLYTSSNAYHHLREEIKSLEVLVFSLLFVSLSPSQVRLLFLLLNVFCGGYYGERDGEGVVIVWLIKEGWFRSTKNMVMATELTLLLSTWGVEFLLVRIMAMV